MSILSDNKDIAVETNNYREPPSASETEISSDVESPIDAPDVISGIYKSMSQIIEALNTDNLILNQQVNKIRSDLGFVCTTLTSLKTDTQDVSIACTNRNNDLLELKKKIATLSDVQKQVLDTRNMLIQTLDSNIRIIKKELNELKNTRESFRPLIKSIIEEEVKLYLSKLPSIETRFESLEREQRTLLASHIRKSITQSNSQDITDIQKLKEQQKEFMEKIESYLSANKTTSQN